MRQIYNIYTQLNTKYKKQKHHGKGDVMTNSAQNIDAEIQSKAVHTRYGEATAAEIEDILEIANEANMSVIIYGEPGVGKTALINSFAEKHNMGAEILIGSQLDACDFSGLPQGTMVDVNGEQVKATVFGAPDWQIRLMSGQSKILFLDEFLNSPPSIQAAELKLVGDRKFANGDPVPDDVFIILATNPVESSVDAGGMLAPPMASRLLQVSMRPSDDEFYKGIVDGWGDEPWDIPEAERAWRERVAAFNKANNGVFITKRIREDEFVNPDTAQAAYMDVNASASASENEILQTAWACPRSWDNVCRMLGKTGFFPEVTALQERILAGTVGRQAAVELAAYAHEHSQIDPFEIIANPEIIEWRITEEGVEYNKIVEIARAVNAAIPKCDGLNGRPSVVQALDFYDKVIDLGGGQHFVEFCQDGKEGGPRHYLKNNRPSDYEKREWTQKIFDILKKFKNNGYIPDQSNGGTWDVN